MMPIVVMGGAETREFMTSSEVPLGTSRATSVAKITEGQARETYCLMAASKDTFSVGTKPLVRLRRSLKMLRSQRPTKPLTQVVAPALGCCDHCERHIGGQEPGDIRGEAGGDPGVSPPGGGRKRGQSTWRR